MWTQYNTGKITKKGFIERKSKSVRSEQKCDIYDLFKNSEFIEN